MIPALKTDHIKSVDYLSHGNSTHYQACDAKVCEAQHQSQDDLDNLLVRVQHSSGRDTGRVVLHICTQLC